MSPAPLDPMLTKNVDRPPVGVIRTVERDEWGDCTYVEGTANDLAFCWEHEGTNRALRDRLRELGFSDTDILAAMGEADRFMLGIFGAPPVSTKRRRFARFIRIYRSLTRRNP